MRLRRFRFGPAAPRLPVILACVLGVLTSGGFGRAAAQGTDQGTNRGTDRSPVAHGLMHSFSGVAVSPDGARIADIEADEPADPETPKVLRLVVRDAATGAPTRVPLPCGDIADCKPASPVFSPDGRSLVFLLQDRTGAGAGGGIARTPPRWQIEQAAADGCCVRRLLAFDGTLQTPRFSADGRLAVLAVTAARKEAGATAAAAALAGEVGAHEDEQRIAVLEGGALRFVSPADLFVYEYQWMPGGHGFVGTAAAGNGDENWYVARLLAFDQAGGAPRTLFAPRSYQQQIASPVVSPDGRTVAFIVGIMSDFGSTGGDVWTAPIAGAGVARDLTRDGRLSFSSLDWSCGDRLIAGDIASTRTCIAIIDAGGRVGQAWQDEATLSAQGSNPGIACGGGTTAGVLQSMVRAPALVAGAIGAWHPVSHDNDGLVARWTARSVSWSDDGLTPSGWLLEPLSTGKGRRPLVTIVHGGPSAASLPTFPRPGPQTALLSAGYDLFLPNPRGSFGQGKAYAAADVRDLGAGPLRDVLAGLDAVERQAPVDPHRLGLFGYSYGGYMALWAPTQTDRFRATVSGAGISDWVSLDGETGVEKADLALFGAPSFDALALYLSESPVAHVNAVHTPVFLFGGDGDIECPIQQSLEFWHDLRALHVPTEFVVYAGQGHGLENPRDLADATRRTLAWFDRYLTPPAGNPAAAAAGSRR